MPTITPHLWYDDQAVEAAKFYCSMFAESTIDSITQIRDTPSGDCDIVSFRLFGQPFMAISAGPLFQFTPAISFTVRCTTVDEVDRYFSTLSQGGKVRMPLDEYPFSRRFGWVADRYGLDWQILLDEEGADGQRIVPSLLFVGDVCGRAEEAVSHWVGVLPGSSIQRIEHWGEDAEHERAGTVYRAQFTLSGQRFHTQDSALDHAFTFNEAISFMVNCDDQQEIDTYWEALSAVPEAEQCGWLKDRFGVSWQIASNAMNEMMASGSREQIDHITQAFLPMKKLDIATLVRAYTGDPVAHS